MILLFLFFNCISILFIILYRYPAPILPYILPIPFNKTILVCLIGIFLITLLFIMKKMWRNFKWKQVSSPFLELMVFPVTFFFLWARVPFDADNIIDILIASFIVILILILLFKDRKHYKESGLTRSNFFLAIKS